MEDRVFDGVLKVEKKEYRKRQVVSWRGKMEGFFVFWEFQNRFGFCNGQFLI